MTSGPQDPSTPGDPSWPGQGQSPWPGQGQSSPTPPGQPWGNAQAQYRPEAQQQPAVWQGQNPAFQQGPGYPAPQVVAPKNPAIGLLISFFIPGVGSMVNGNVGMGVAILITYVVGWFLTIVLIGFIIAPAAWIWGMIDGYQSAQRWNAAHGIIS